MKKIQISEGIKPFYLIFPLLLSACHTDPLWPGLNDMMVTDYNYIDPTKSLFQLENYPQPVDKWLPLGPERHISIIDTAAQLRHFSDLKSHYFGMRTGDKSPWNESYITSVLSQRAEADRDASIKKFLGENSISCQFMSNVSHLMTLPVKNVQNIENGMLYWIKYMKTLGKLCKKRQKG